MSRLRVPNAAEQRFLESYIDAATAGGGLTLRLFTNDVEAGLTPDQVDELDAADFTEATFDGYAAVTINSGWTYTQGNPTAAVNTERTFTRATTGTAELVRGYYLTLVSDGSLQWHEQFDGPVSVEFAADAVVVRPRLTLDDGEGSVIPTGLFAPYVAGTAPDGWLLCDGSAVSRTTYADLFAVMGETYGAGDGSTTFNLPDTRQRFPLGLAASGTGATLGETGGSIDHVHDLDTSSSHARISWTTSTGSDDPQMRQRTGVPSWNSTKAGNQSYGAAVGTSFTDGAQLAGDTDAENPPYLTVVYIVKA